MADFNNVMIDIETLAVLPNAIILSIAAVKFNFGDDAVQQFSVNIDPISSRTYGLVSDKRTVEWWMEKPKDVIKEFSKNRVSLPDAIHALSEFIGDDWINCKFWANGANFDFPILESSYRAVGAKEPWKYWNLRDTRTIYSVFDLDFKSYPRVGLYHNAIDDCMTQIKALKECLI